MTCFKKRNKSYVFSLETKGGTHDDRDEREPPQAITDIFREGEERPLDKRNPDRFDGTRDNRVGDKPESDDGNEGPCEDGLQDPPVARRLQDNGRDPPCEDDRRKGKELHTAHETAVSG